MVGRDAEIAAADRLVADTRAGNGGALLVVGEAGIGKTRLVREITTRARRSGCSVLTGHAAPGGGTYRPLAEAVLAYARDGHDIDAPDLRPFSSALSRLAPGWAGEDADRYLDRESAGPDQVLVLGEGLLRLLIAAGSGSGSLLVVEDLHWADADTLSVLQYLVRAARANQVLLVLSTRDEPSSPIGLLAGQDALHVAWLDRLDDEAVAALAVAHAGRPLSDAVRTLVVDAADGLPVLVEELVSGALDSPSGPVPLPRTFAGLVTRRLDALSLDAQRVLRAASVLDQEPDWALLPGVAGLEPSLVSDALRDATGLLAQRGSTLVWRHALTRSAVRASIPPTERTFLVSRAADLLQARDRPADDALAAALLVEAGEHRRGARVMVRLARRDLGRGALLSGGDWLERAAELGAQPTEIVREQVRLLTLRGRAPEALEVGTAVLDQLTGDEHAELCLQLARTAVTAGRWKQARRLVERAGRPADPLSATLLAEAWFGEGDVERAGQLARVAVDGADAAGQPATLCAALVIAGRCASRTSAAAAVVDLARAAQCAAEHGLVPWRVEALFGIGLCELTEGQSMESLPEARELALDAGLFTQVLSIDVILSELAMTRDGPVAAEPSARQTLEQAVALGLLGLAGMCQLTIAAARGVAGDTGGMSQALAAAAAYPDAPLESISLASAVRALPCLLDHDLARANILVDEGMSRLMRHGAAAPVTYWGLWVLLRTIESDRDEEARDFLRGSAVGRANVNRAGLAYADAVHAGRTGDPDRAWELVVAGDRLIADRPWWGRLLRLLVAERAVLDGWGDPVPLLRADLLAHQAAGEARLARICRDVLRRAGAETRRGRGDTPVPPPLVARGVTSREMDVLRLVAQGLTNAEVASRLVVSPRTVDTHVASLLAKTGTSRRAQLRDLSTGGSDATIPGR